MISLNHGNHDYLIHSWNKETEGLRGGKGEQEKKTLVLLVSNAFQTNVALCSFLFIIICVFILLSEDEQMRNYYF